MKIASKKKSKKGGSVNKGSVKSGAPKSKAKSAKSAATAHSAASSAQSALSKATTVKAAKSQKSKNVQAPTSTSSNNKRSTKPSAMTKSEHKNNKKVKPALKVNGKEEEDSSQTVEEKKGLRKLSNNPFSQQRLSACTPTLTVGSAIVPFLMLSVCFGIIGAALYYCNSGVVEFQFEYTDCEDYITGVKCSSMNLSSTDTTNSTSCLCHLRVKIREAIPSSVYVYYRIDNMYQNYMIYSSSRDDSQLLGKLNGSEDLCGSYTTWNHQLIAPCGMIANSLFNDTFQLNRLVNQTKQDQSESSFYLIPVKLLTTDITLTPRYAMKNPVPTATCPASMTTLQCAFNGSVSPPNWRQPIWALDTNEDDKTGNNNSSNDNNGYLNEHFQTWMRPAPFPSFRKLWGRVDHDDSLLNGTFAKQLHEGEYVFMIEYNYPVSVFSGRKYIVLSNVSWLGGRNFFMSYLYIISAAICLILVIVFYFVDRKYGKESSRVYSFVRDRSN